MGSDQEFEEKDYVDFHLSLVLARIEHDDLRVRLKEIMDERWRRVHRPKIVSCQNKDQST